MIFLFLLYTALISLKFSIVLPQPLSPPPPPTPPLKNSSVLGKLWDPVFLIGRGTFPLCLPSWSAPVVFLISAGWKAIFWRKVMFAKRRICEGFNRSSPRLNSELVPQWGLVCQDLKPKVCPSNILLTEYFWIIWQFEISTFIQRRTY